MSLVKDATNNDEPNSFSLERLLEMLYHQKLSF